MAELFPLLLPPGLVMLALIALSAFCSGSETALFYLSPDELRAMRVGRPRERAVAALLSNPDRLLTAVLFWNLVTNMTYFAVSVVAAGRLTRAGHTASAGAFGAVALGAIILLGEVLPKSVAVVFRQRLAVISVWPLSLLVRSVDPIAPPLASLTEALRRAFWPKLEAEPLLDANDLERAVEASTQSQEVVQKERQVLHNVLDLSEIRVEEAMRPRGSFRVCTPPVSRLEITGPLPPGNIIALRESGSDEIDRILSLSDLSHLPERNVETKSVPLVHVPWCASLADALQLVRTRNVPAASVVNELGETIGIITRDDLMDALFIPEADRARRLWRRDPVVEVAPGVYHAEGLATLRHLSVRLGLDYDPDEEGNVTLAGMLLEEFERLPEPGEKVRWQNHELTVIDVAERSVKRVLVEPLREPELGVEGLKG